MSITNINPKTILKELNQLKPKTRTEAVNITITKKFLSININQGPNVNKDYYLKEKYKLTINGKNYYMLDYYDQILDSFKNNNIPTYEKLFELSLLRLSKSQPILPLIKEQK